jgi:hypothetical protein
MVDDIVALASAVAARAGNGQIAFVASSKQAIALALRSQRAIPSAFCSLEHRKARGDRTNASVPAGTLVPAGRREFGYPATQVDW